MANLDALLRPGALLKESFGVPPTIRNAMQLTKLMGHKYLWVDRYCIPQDSFEAKAKMIEAMEIIYSAASLTLCAASGDSGTGIPGIFGRKRNSSQIIETYKEGVQLIVAQPAEFYIHRSRWNSRAWTFQERLCSKKCLIFVDGRVFFQCQHSMLREDIHMESMLSHGLGWSLDQKEVPGRLFQENPIRQYTKCVQLFTQRQLSFDADILPAFSAIQKVLSLNLNSDFLAGLPTSCFDFGLLWIQKAPLKRIDSYPSWSWCGWQGAIEYR